MNLSAFILAAGRGQRLLPITDFIPKPLLPVLGRPVLEIVLSRLAPFASRIGINLHHKKEMIESWIDSSDFRDAVRIFPEDPVLGTGGALKNAEAFLGDNTFLVHNSDILSDIDIGRLVGFHRESHSIATLAVHDYARFNSLRIDGKGTLKGLMKDVPSKNNGEQILAFTGIAVYNPEFLKFLPEGISSVVDGWFSAISAGFRITTFNVTGSYWTDIGTPVSYMRAVFRELRQEGETVFIHPSAHGCASAEMDGCVVMEKDSLSDSRQLRNCILLPGKGMEENTPHWKNIDNCIASPDFRIEMRETEIFPEEGPGRFIGTGGSDRKYYRVKSRSGTAVLMQCSPDDPDYERHIEYSRFFAGHEVPVPHLLQTNPSGKEALFEDLGDLSLYSWLKCRRKETAIVEIYRKVLDILVSLHTIDMGILSGCPLLPERLFDYAHLRWETGYFLEQFARDAADTSTIDITALNEEFHRIALLVDSFPKTAVHRDFQSQNIMITSGLIPRVIDYQGARMGPSAYDLASILWDPYFTIHADLREELIAYYVDRRSQLSGTEMSGMFDKQALLDTIVPCRLQRHMQALGAYGFLSRVKGKPYFRKFIPEGMRLLKEDVSMTKEEYPLLQNLIESIAV